MKELHLNEETILERIDIIEHSVRKLEKLKPLTFGRFILDENFAIAEHYLRYGLEATFDICNHILSRIPGVKMDEYKKMALEMGKQEIIPIEFAEKVLHEMAGYRNRLTHLYAQVTPEEMYTIIQKKLGDFEFFVTHIKTLLQK